MDKEKFLQFITSLFLLAGLVLIIALTVMFVATFLIYVGKFLYLKV